MSAYNVLLIKYRGAQQLRIYSEPIHQGDSITEKRVQTRALYDSIRKESVKERTEEQVAHSVHTSKSRTVQNIYAVSRCNEWDYFITLTFDRKKTDASDYPLVVRRVSNWLSHLRQRHCPGLKYLVVPELHKDGKNWHIHALFGDCEGLPLSDSGKRDKQGRIIYNLPSYPWGWNTATPVTNNFAVCHYVTKYITKDLILGTKNRKRVWISRNVDRPTAEKAYLSSWDIENLIKENAENIKHAQEKGDDLKHIKYIELENAEGILKKYRPEIAHGWQPCLYDFDEIEKEECDPLFEEVEVVNRLKHKKDLSLERMRRVMMKYGRRPDTSAPLWPGGVPERIRKQREALGLCSYPEDGDAFMWGGDLPDYALNW